jgi:hypothetical protein
MISETQSSESEIELQIERLDYISKNFVYEVYYYHQYKYKLSSFQELCLELTDDVLEKFICSSRDDEYPTKQIYQCNFLRIHYLS